MRSNKHPCIQGWALAISVVLVLAGCLGGGSGTSSVSNNSSPGAAQNVLPISVDAGPAKTINIPFVNVTICAPGTSNCQTIDHVIIDTGSTGLRIISSVLTPLLATALTQQTISNGSPLVECYTFADGYVWGPVKNADVTLGGESVDSLAIQVIGDPGFRSVPHACSNSGPAENSVQTFGGNGILGLAVFQQDCGPYCVQSAIPGTYYSCTGASCLAISVDLAQQVQNPVGLLASDNNGVIIDLPSVPATGAATASGSLFLGIGTQANNGLGSAVVFALDPNYGTLTTMFNGQSYSGFNGGFIDSGSNGIFFPDGATPVCSSGFYCPVSPQQLTATNLGTNGNSGTVNFTVANADNLLNTADTAFSNLAGPNSSFDWGLPFHFGRRVFTAIEGKNSPGGSGPYVAY